MKWVSLLTSIMIDITITTIPQDQQRYSTHGDWFSDEPWHVTIRVSDLSNARYEVLIAIHELIEMFLCHDRGIGEDMVDKFDLAWKGEGEPGDDPESPYFKEHQFATIIERLMAHELGVDWQTYNQRLSEI
jgi:hypothetical protein